MNTKNRSYKTCGCEETAKATQSKTGGRDLCQEIARQQLNRERNYNTQSHKSNQRLPGSPDRTDSREQIYSLMGVWSGMHHE